MADGLQTLLNYIVEHPIMQNATREAEIDATAVQDVPDEISKIATDVRDDAVRLGAYFARGLRMAAREKGQLVIEDTNPVGNLIADAFARFLVAPGLATSQSEQIAEGHYRYTFDVDWDRLRAIGQRAGVDLDAAVAVEQT